MIIEKTVTPEVTINPEVIAEVVAPAPEVVTEVIPPVVETEGSISSLIDAILADVKTGMANGWTLKALREIVYAKEINKSTIVSLDLGIILPLGCALISVRTAGAIQGSILISSLGVLTAPDSVVSGVISGVLSGQLQLLVEDDSLLTLTSVKIP
jgi:hypothetical protein